MRYDLKLVELEQLIFDKFKNILNNDTLNNNKNINRLIDINIMHSNKNINTGFLHTSKEYKKCPFCQLSFDQSKYCSLYLSFNRTDSIKKLIEDFNKRTKYLEPLILLARSEYYDMNKKVYDDFNFEENDLINKKGIYMILLIYLVNLNLWEKTIYGIVLVANR